MPWMINYDSDNGDIKSFYHTDRHKEIPDPTIEISDTEYVNAATNQKLFKVDVTTKTLQRVNPA